MPADRVDAEGGASVSKCAVAPFLDVDANTVAGTASGRQLMWDVTFGFGDGKQLRDVTFGFACGMSPLALPPLALRVGQKVRFTFQGEEHVGMVNRVGLRATVLVVNPRGRRYSDGNHYHKYLIPPARLTVN